MNRQFIENIRSVQKEYFEDLRKKLFEHQTKVNQEVDAEFGRLFPVGWRDACLNEFIQTIDIRDRTKIIIGPGTIPDDPIGQTMLINRITRELDGIQISFVDADDGTTIRPDSILSRGKKFLIRLHFEVLF